MSESQEAQINDIAPDQVKPITFDELVSSVQDLSSSLSSYGSAISPVSKDIQSPNFKEGSTGWRLTSAGNLEANDGTFRGDISATTIDIGGSDATSFHVDVDGNMWLGASTYAAAPFKVSNAGVLSATKRVVTVTQSATPAINTDVTDVASITGLAQDITSMTTNLTGTPTAGQLIIIQITDNGTARAITWGNSFASTLVSLPLTTTISTLLRVGFQWNSTTSKWDCIALA